MPHTLTDKQKQALDTLARQVITRLELSARVRHMDREGRVRQRVESALTVERNFVSTVLDTVGALVAVFDTAGRIVRFNRTCEQVSGYDFASLVGATSGTSSFRPGKSRPKSPTSSGCAPASSPPALRTTGAARTAR